MLKLHKLLFYDVGTLFFQGAYYLCLDPSAVITEPGEKGDVRDLVTISIRVKHVLGCLFLLQTRKEGLFCHMGGVERQVWLNMPSCIYAYSWSDALPRKTESCSRGSGTELSVQLRKAPEHLSCFIMIQAHR